MTKTVLCIAAHPDDEAIGCGGTLAKHILAGDDVHVIFLADGVTSRKGCVPQDVCAREEMTARAMAHLRIPLSQVHFLGFSDQRMDAAPLLDVVQAIERQLEQIGPVDIVYTHHVGDLNRDHCVAHIAAMTVFRPKPGSRLTEIHCFEIPSATGWAFDLRNSFEPNTRVDIDGLPVERKIAAISAYHTEIPGWPHARSIMAIDALMKYRGSSVGLECAEAFVTPLLVRK